MLHHVKFPKDLYVMRFLEKESPYLIQVGARFTTRFAYLITHLAKHITLKYV